MAKIVCVHGIAQEYKAKEVIAAEWIPSLCGGVSNASGHLDPSDVDMCFYGGLFRPQEDRKAGAPGLAMEVEGDLEQALLEALADAAEPDTSRAEKAASLHRPVQALLHRVANVPFFGRCAQEVVVWWLKQVHWYVTNRNQTRRLAQERLFASLAPDTRLVVGHSLGSIVAYEALCSADPRVAGVTTLVTLGSPLGIPALRSHLQPPFALGRGQWPHGVLQWVNVADRTDIVALEKNLAPLFDDRIEDVLVHNGPKIHDVSPYLTAPETGRAILAGLALAGSGH